MLVVMYQLYQWLPVSVSPSVRVGERWLITLFFIKDQLTDVLLLVKVQSVPHSLSSNVTVFARLVCWPSADTHPQCDIFATYFEYFEGWEPHSQNCDQDIDKLRKTYNRFEPQILIFLSLSFTFQLLCDHQPGCCRTFYQINIQNQVEI